MRSFFPIFAAVALAVASFASSASATVVGSRLISIEYASLDTVSAPFSDSGFLASGDTATLKIFVSKNYSVQSKNSRVRIRSNTGWIRVFNNSGNFIELSAGGVDLQIRNGDLRFASRNRGNNADNGETWLSIGPSVNNISFDTPLVDRTYAAALLALENGNIAGGASLNIQTRDASGGGSTDSLTNTAGPVIANVTVSTVPLPAGAWLLLGGMGIMALRRKRAA